MAQPAGSKRRIVRLALVAAGGLALAAGAFGNAMGNVLAAREPLVALRFDSANAVALAGAATQSVSASVGGPSAKRGEAARLALAALRQGPVSAAAMRAVAASSLVTGTVARSDRQFRLAERMSRRDLPTQVALVELCVTRNDVGCALRHYDIALTTSAANAEPLFPVLSAALSDATIARAVAPYVRSGRPWVAEFMGYAAMQADPAAAASVVIASRGLPPGGPNRESEGVILGRLAAAGQWDMVRRTYDALEGAQAAASPELGFTRRTIDPHRIPVAWQLVSSGSVAADFEPVRADRFRLRLDAPGGAAGDVQAGRRLLFLPPGTQQALVVTLGETSLPADGALGLSLRCLSPGSAAGTDMAAWRRTGLRQAKYVWRFAVPPACAAQELLLSVKGAAEMTDGTIAIEGIVQAVARKEDR